MLCCLALKVEIQCSLSPLCNFSMQHMKVEQESILKMEGKQLFAIETEVVLKKKQVFFLQKTKGHNW